MVVPRAAGIERRHDGVKAERTVRLRNDMATIAKADIVVFAILIGMPEFNHRATNRATSLGQDKARKFKRFALGAKLTKIAALRRFRLEKRSLRLGDGWFIAIVTVRRGRKLLCKGCVRAGQFAPGGKHSGVEQKSPPSRFRSSVHNRLPLFMSPCSKRRSHNGGWREPPLQFAARQFAVSYFRFDIGRYSRKVAPV